MNKRGLAVCALGVGLLWGSARSAADTIESVEKAIVESSKKVKSFTAAIHSTTEISTEGFKSKTVSDGRFEMLRKDGKGFTRMETKETMATEIGGKTEKRESTTLLIADGEFSYVLNQAEGQKTAYKMKSQMDWEQNPFELLRKTHDLELLPDEKIDDQAVYVVQATPKKSAEASASGKMTQYYRKDCGFPVKIVAFDPAGKPMTTMTYSDLKIDANLSADRFVFKAPEGVPVQDMTKMTPPDEKDGDKTGARKGEEPKKDGPAKKDEEPKKDEQPKKSGPKLPKLPELPKRP